MSEREELEAVIEKALLAASVDDQGVPDIDDQARLVAQALSALPNDEPNVDVNRLTEACRVCGGSGRVATKKDTTHDQ